MEDYRRIYELHMLSVPKYKSAQTIKSDQCQLCYVCSRKHYFTFFASLLQNKLHWCRFRFTILEYLVLIRFYLYQIGSCDAGELTHSSDRQLVTVNSRKWARQQLCVLCICYIDNNDDDNDNVIVTQYTVL